MTHPEREETAMSEGRVVEIEAERRERVIHHLRLRGWSRMDAENEADNFLARVAEARARQQEQK